MSFTIETLPGGGGFWLGLAVYGAVAVLGGQKIAGREIDRLGWKELCAEAINVDIQRRRTPKPVVPERRCRDEAGKLPAILGPWGDLARALCEEFGNPDLNEGARQFEQELYDQKKAAEDRQFGRIAAKAGDRCSCAEAVFKTQNMAQLGLYAGTARVYTPHVVENLEQSLIRGLGTPECAALSGEAS